MIPLIILTLSALVSAPSIYRTNDVSYKDAVKNWYNWVVQYPLGNNPIYDDDDGKM